jgi:GST-like protein
MDKPITLYTAPTPNGRKVSIALEEMDLAYEARFVDIMSGGQHKPEFLALNPNNKFPVIEDPNTPDGKPLILWESGAILWYLAEKTGLFLPQSGPARAHVHQWLMFQMASVGPMFGQAAHFTFYAKDKHAYAIERYSNELIRLMRVMDEHLANREWFAGEEYSIADMAILPWVASAVDNPAMPTRKNLSDWTKRLKARPAVERGYTAMDEFIRPEVVEGGLVGLNDDHRSQLFGKAQYERNG